MWTKNDEDRVLYPYKDAVVIKANVANKEFNKILVNSGSSVDVLFKYALKEMGIMNLSLEHTNTSLKGFGRGRLTPLGVVELPVMIGSRPFEKTMMLNFVVVEEDNAYQMIFGRLFLRISKSVMSNYYIAIKYRVNGVVRVLKGDQRIVRSCYATTAKETIQITLLDAQGEFKRGSQEPGEDTIEVMIGCDDLCKIMKIGLNLNE